LLDTPLAHPYGESVIEMRVREVRRSSEGSRPVAILERRGEGDPLELELSLGAAEAHALTHELRGHRTLRSHTLATMTRVLAGLHGRLTAVEVGPGADEAPVGRLRVVGPHGELDITVCVGQALGLAVTQRIPLLVAESLLAPPDSAGQPSEPAPEVPEIFFRAFVE
jgi:bifunctional DNase/RNase